MDKREVSVLWDPEGDILEVIWQEGKGYFTATDDERVLERVDENGNSLGFMVQGLSTMAGFPAKTFTLGSQPRPRFVTTGGAAAELGITAGRLRQLLAEGRVKDAVRLRRDWVIRSPVEITPGARGPIGAAGQRHREAGS